MRRASDASGFVVKQVARRWPRTGIVLVAAMVTIALVTTSSVKAQDQPPINKAQSPSPQSTALGEQDLPPNVTANVSPYAGARFESSQILSLPEMFVRQWTFDKERLPRDLFSITADDQANKLTLKETIYLALRNNPGLGSVPWIRLP